MLDLLYPLPDPRIFLLTFLRTQTVGALFRDTLRIGFSQFSHLFSRFYFSFLLSPFYTALYLYGHGLMHNLILEKRSTCALGDLNTI